MASYEGKKAMLDQVKRLGKGVEIVEELRNEKSADNLFAGIFNGEPPFEQVFADWPKPSAEEVARRNKVMDDVIDFLIKKVDIYSVDDTGSVPIEVFEGMAKLGLFGLKAPKEFGGMGLSNTSYIDILTLLASWCSAPVIAVSAHNTIGCVFPVMYYGTDDQKNRLLPELIKWPTGFCLTEENVGSDASNIKTYAQRVRWESLVGYVITGEKWFTTNGILDDGQCLAKYLAVVARIVDHPDELNDTNKKACYGLFIVPTDAKGVDIGTRNHFVGMRGIHNSNPRFNKVLVPPFNLIGGEGAGLKIAFESLNTGRIAIAKGCIGASKQALNLTRWWALKRSQLGGPLADKELVRDKLIYAASNILAMEAMAKYASICFDNGQDVRIEAAAVKTFASEKAWQIADNLAQTRGGRFYETWQSLSKRELTPPDEVYWTASRPNKIFEGSNEVMVQLMFREGTDRYIKAGMPLMSKDSSLIEKLKAIFKMTGYYLLSTNPYLPNWLMSHVKFVDHRSNKLARKIITISARYQKRLAVKQLTMDRFSRIAINLGAMTLTCAYAQQLDRENPGHDYVQLADVFCRTTRREVDELFKALKDNDDDYRWKVSKRLLTGDFDEFLLGGIIPMTEEHMKGPEKKL